MVDSAEEGATMTNEELTQLLGDFEKRLTAIAAQAAKAGEQAQKTLVLVKALHEEVAHARKTVISTTETQEHVPLPPKVIRKQPAGGS
jgi:hypothetical protein